MAQELVASSVAVESVLIAENASRPTNSALHEPAVVGFRGDTSNDVRNAGT
jgi:hypothetical protein